MYEPVQEVINLTLHFKMYSYFNYMHRSMSVHKIVCPLVHTAGYIPDNHFIMDSAYNYTPRRQQGPNLLHGIIMSLDRNVYDSYMQI